MYNTCERMEIDTWNLDYDMRQYKIKVHN